MGEEAGQGDADAEEHDGERRQAVLGQDHHHVDRGEGQEAGDLAHRLDQADVLPLQMHRFDGKVVD